MKGEPPAIPVENNERLLSDGRLQGIVRDIGLPEREEKERAELDAVLRQSELRFRSLIEHSHDAIALFGADGVVLYTSPSTTRIIGYQPDELRHRNFSEFVRPDWIDKVRETMAEVLRCPGVGIPAEAYVRHKNGEYRFLEGTFTNLLDEPCVGAIVNNYRDITERKQAEERLNLSEKKFSDAFRTSPAGITITRIADGRFLDVNEAFLRIFGFTREEVIGHTSIELNMLTVKEREKLIAAQVESGGLRNAELSARTKSGKVVNLLFSSGPIEWEGEIRHITTLIDITDRKRAEEALRVREDQYRDLVDNMRDLVCTHDLQGRLLFVNRASAELLGYAPHELLGKNLREILDDRNLHLFDDYLKAIQTAREASGLMTVRTRSGEARIWEYHNTLRSDGIEGPTVRGLARDITGRKRAEDALRASRDQLRALSGRLLAVREEEGTRIAREIHDELGGVLTGLKWDLEDCEKILSASANGEPTATIRKKIPVMTGLLDATIDTVRRISSELRPGVLDDLGLVAAIEWQAQQFQRRTGLTAQCESCGDVDLPRERAVAVFRAFQEMLTNVLRHARATRVEIVMAHDGHEFVLEVRDNGCGITGAELADTKSLGLLGMRERIQLIDGKIEISGVKGKGTKVVVSVPLR
jgi:PAS domain S-box-containing protein